MKKTKIIVLVALALVIVGSLGGWVAFSASDSLIVVSETKTVDQNFSAIKIDSDNIGIEIRPTENNIATIEMTGQTHRSVLYSLDVAIEGDTLTVLTSMSNPTSWVNIYPNNLKIVVSLPEKQYQSLQAKGDSGSITLVGIISKVVTLESDAHIGLINVVSDSVTVQTSASIDLERVEADEITAKTDARIRLSTSHIERNINLDAGSGSIQVKTESAPENIRFEVSSNGSINLLGGRYDGGVSAGDGKYLVRLIAVGSITVEEAS